MTKKIPGFGAGLFTRKRKTCGARLAHRRVGSREHFRCRRCKLTPQKVGSDSELSRGRLQPSRRAECDLLRKRRGVRRVCALIFTKKSEQAIQSLLRRGWAGWIRTSGMTESKSVALPLGDSPISKCILAKIGLPYSGKYEKKAKSLFLLYGVDSRIRTDGLQSHNLAL